MRGSHDVRLRGRGDQEHNGGREILASRMLLGRYSGYFRNLFNTMQVRNLVNPWVVNMTHFPQAGTVDGGHAPFVHVNMSYG